MRNLILCAIVLSVLLTQNRAVAAIDGELMRPEVKKAWELLKGNRPVDALTLLSEYRSRSKAPADFRSAAEFHFVYARTVESLGRPVQAIEHLRRAYLFAGPGEMKELTLLQRGEAYLRMGCFYEANTCFAVFLKYYADSKYCARAEMGLGIGLAGAGLLREAAEHLALAGDSEETLLAKANVFQRLGMKKDAGDIYKAVLSQDPGYFRHSGGAAYFSDQGAALEMRPYPPLREESLYYYGENLRSTAGTADAKKYLSAVREPPFREMAAISLGEIALEERRNEEAAKYFNDALLSGARAVRRTALLRLSAALKNMGRNGEAGEALIRLREKYPYGAEYDEATLRLSGLYIGEGKNGEATRLLKELVFRPSPSREALDRLEAILRAIRERGEKEKLEDLWESVGPRLLDVSREAFLMEMMETFDSNSREFRGISSWLIRNGSQGARDRCLAALAAAYADGGDTAAARDCLGRIKSPKQVGDEVLRAEARIRYLEKDLKSAAERLMSVKRFRQADLRILANSVTSAPDPKKALARYERAFGEAGGGVADALRIGDIHLERGERAEAAEWYRRALAREPENAWALYRSAQLASFDDAASLLEKVPSGDALLRKSADAQLKEMDIVKRVMENF